MNIYDIYSKVIASCQHPFLVVDQAPELTAPDKLYAKSGSITVTDGVAFPACTVFFSRAF